MVERKFRFRFEPTSSLRMAGKSIDRGFGGLGGFRDVPISSGGCVSSTSSSQQSKKRLEVKQ
jgi:hypothetical protein